MALVVAGAAGAPSAAPPATAPTPSAAALTPAQLAGQRMVFGFPGTTPPPDLVRRIRRGEAGAVILLGPNVPSRAAARALIGRLQAIARPAAVDVPLLVMIDQEGGRVRRLAGPPTRSAAELGQEGPRAARAAGRATGRSLAGVGVNVDLAPVADVARPGSFLEADGRTFGRSPARVAGAATAFADGLRDGGVAATAKHFPGLGSATRSTDEAPVRLDVDAATLRRVDLRPFRALVAHGVPLVMLGTATYPALDPARPAALSRPVATDLLRGELGFRGVSVTDALDTPALAPSGGTAAVSLRAAGAGSDLILHTGYPAGTASAAALTRAIRTGALPRADAEAAVSRILALRASLG
ncbi:MAG TPA: glycoside hydrolase family 3 N-terminal domain-containing protein [Miltoncostaea sp.]|nr:glycoside hydrolase family 3 N-terminal domain-containing protein [Miltoncostaea sp.]